MSTPLTTGDVMPPVMAKDADGNEVDIVASVKGHWALVQFYRGCLLYTSPSPRDATLSRMPSSA